MAKSRPSQHKTARHPDKAKTSSAAPAVNPLLLVAGGVAAGVVAGALLPRSARERDLLAPVGARLGTSLTAAVEAAKEAGKAELDGAGISRDNARDQARALFDNLLKAATAAGSAAVAAAGQAGAASPPPSETTPAPTR